MENANGGDWQEEIYEKIKSMKEMYFLKLSDLSQKIACDVQRNFLYQHRTNELIEKLEMFKVALERILRFLRLHKHDIQLIHKEKLLLVEKHINFFLNPDQLREPTSSLLQEQLPQSSMQFHQPQSLDGQTNPPMQPVQGSMEAPLDSTSQAGNTNGADWQEVVYKKIKSMKEMYFSKLSDLSQKIVCEVQKNFFLHHLTNEQIEKLNMFKVTLERILRFLGLNKQDIQLIHKEKLLSVEKYINFFLSPDPPRMPTSSPLQEQLPHSSMQFQQPQSLDGQTNPSMQPVQRSMATMQQNNFTNLEHNSLSGVLTISYSQQHMINTLETGFSVDLGQGNSLNALRLVITGSLQQRPVNSPQQVNINSPQQVNISLRSGMNPILANLGTLQQNSSTLQQSLPMQHEQQLLQIQQLRQQYHHRQMQQRLFQRRELRRHQQMLQNHQLRQLYHHQQMQQQLFQRQQSRRHQQMLQNQQLRRQYHHQQMRQQVLQRRQLMQTAASKATADHAIANPPDVTASTVFHAASATTMS